MSDSGTITEADILSRIILPDEGSLSPEAARALLDLAFAEPDIERMNQLAEKNRQGTLTEAERADMQKYMRIGHVMNMLKSKARLSLMESAHG